MIYGLPQRLLAMRKKLTYSQREVAARLGVSSSLICGYENGERTPSLEMLLRLSSIYQCSTDFLLGKSSSGAGNSLSLDGLTHNQISLLTSLQLEFRMSNAKEAGL